MKRFSKVIALALLLAVVVSAFGIFSAFAEEVVDTGISVFYDSNGETAWSSTVGGNNASSSKYPLLTKADSTTSRYGSTYRATLPSFLDENNNRYYKYGYNVAFPAADVEAGGKITLSNPWFSPTKLSTILVADSTLGTRNTDFIVLDFDIDPSHLYTGYFQPQLRFQNASGSSMQGTHMRVYGGDATGEFKIGLSSGTKYTIKSATDTNWLNITVIMDTRDVANSSTAYLYANGLFVCSYKAMNAGAAQLTDARICLETNGLEVYGNNATGHTADIANFTVKSFKKDYAGALGQNFDKVGNSFYTLDNFSDLAYWDDNQISDYIATVEHEDGSTDTLKSLDDFGAVVKAGDEVTLNGHIFNSLFIPGKTEIVDEAEVVTPLVTFNTNGYYMADPIAVDTEKYDWVIKDNSGNITYGSQDGLLISSDYNEDGYKDGDYNFDGVINTYYVKADEAASFIYQTYDEFAALGLTTSEAADDVYTTKIEEANRYTVKDPLFTAIPHNTSATITLLNDITMYGPGSKGVESSSTATKALYYNHYFNLNGKTLTVDARVTHLFSCNGEYNNNVVFRNGTLIFTSPASNNLLYWDNSSNTDEATYYGTATFDNLTKLEVNKVLIDQRIGVIRFINCDDIVTNGTLVSEKSARIKFAKVLLYDSTITANESPFVIANISSGGYQGSHNNELNITKSTIAADGCTPIQLLTRNEGGTNELGLLNNNKTTVLISGSTITADGGSFFYDAPSFSTINANTDPSTTVFTTNANVNVVNGSTISVTGYIFNREFEKAGTKNAYESAIAQYAGVDYNFNLFVDSSSKVASGLTFFDCYYGNKEYEVDFTLTAEEGALIGYPELTNDSDEVVITLPEGNKLAFTNTNEGYNHIVTSNYTTNTYTKGTAVVDEEFYWNIAENEEVIMEWVTDLAETVAYKYTWATAALENGTAYTATLAPNFNPSVSMSTDGTLALNLFLPTEVYTALGGENVNFASTLGYEIDKALDVSLGQYGKEGTFVQAKVKGIDPSKANETAVTVTFNIIGAYNDSIEKSIDVSVVSYAKMVIKNGTAAEKQYAVQLLNYVKAVIAYIGEDTTAITAIDNIIAESGLTVNVGNVGEAAAGGAVTGIDEFSMNLGGSINWVLTVSGNDTYTVSYTRDGETVTVERTAENGEIVISLRAYDALGTVTVTNNSDDTSSTFNIANYYAAQNENAKAVLTALAAYASEAAAYKAQLDAAN